MRPYLWLILLTACTEHGKGGGVPPTDGGGSGLPCGGFGGGSCPPTEFCDFGTNSCGAADESGTCKTRPFDCGDQRFIATCGCDGQIHGSPCEANLAGFDVDASGGCPLDPGQFACGFLACQRGSEFCQRTGSDIGGEGDSFACLTVPAQCTQVDCACVAGEPCGSSCTDEGNGAVTVTCFGG